MKFEYKGLVGIAALRKKREDEKKAAGTRKALREKREIITRIVEELNPSGNRRQRRIEAKLFKKDPINYHKNTGMHITKRGVIFD